jgi:hypothetical protein
VVTLLLPQIKPAGKTGAEMFSLMLKECHFGLWISYVVWGRNRDDRFWKRQKWLNRTGTTLLMKKAGL